MKKRLSFYVINENANQFDDYMENMIKALSDVSDQIVVLFPEQIRNLEKCKIADEADSYAKGQLSFGPYKARMDACDEVVICEDMLMGPVCPFEEMFFKMSEKGSDIWEVYPVENSLFHGLCVISNRELIQRLSSLESDWQEQSLLAYAEEHGYLVESYIDMASYRCLTAEPAILYSYEFVEKYRCPVFDYRIFSHSYTDVLDMGVGDGGKRLYDILKKSTQFHLDAFWDKILRDVNQADFAHNLNLNYIVDASRKVESMDTVKKVALIMHLYYEDLFEESLQYALSMPVYAKIYITTDSVLKKEKLEKLLDILSPRQCEVRLIENRGRDISSLLVGVKDIIHDFDYACFVHDKKTTQVEQGAVGKGFAARIFDNTLYNQDFVEGIIALFDENPRLGMLSPAPPNHSDYFPTIGQEWGVNFKETKALAEVLNLNVPLDEEKEPIAPFGTCFWFRTKALEPLFAKDWEYSDFPPEPNGTDGTILHAIERIYPYAAQSAGYYPAFILEKNYARLDLTNFQYYIRNYNYELLNYGGIGGRYGFMQERLRDILNGGKTPVQDMLDQYVEAEQKAREELQKYKEAHDRVVVEWENAANAYKESNAQLMSTKEQLQQVDAEWKKAADAYVETNHALSEMTDKYFETQKKYDELQVKYGHTIRGIMERIFKRLKRNTNA